MTGAGSFVRRETSASAIRMCRRLAYEHRLLVGGSAGSVLAAVVRRCPEIPPGARVVAISPDLGNHYLPAIYNNDRRFPTTARRP